MASGVKRPLVLLYPDLLLLLLGRESVELSAIVAGGTSDGVMEGQTKTKRALENAMRR